jgi:hypothetical protein
MAPRLPAGAGAPARPAPRRVSPSALLALFAGIVFLVLLAANPDRVGSWVLPAIVLVVAGAVSARDQRQRSGSPTLRHAILGTLPLVIAAVLAVLASDTDPGSVLAMLVVVFVGASVAFSFGGAIGRLVTGWRAG